MLVHPPKINIQVAVCIALVFCHATITSSFATESCQSIELKRCCCCCLIFFWGVYAELKRKQELVDQRKQLRQVANNVGVEDAEREGAKQKLEFIESQTRGRGSIPGVVEAEETTNLYLGNLSPEVYHNR